MSNKANQWVADLGKDWYEHIPIHVMPNAEKFWRRRGYTLEILGTSRKKKSYWVHGKKGSIHANETRTS